MRRLLGLAASVAAVVACMVAADYAGRRLDGWPKLAVAVLVLATLTVVIAQPHRRTR